MDTPVKVYIPVRKSAKPDREIDSSATMIYPGEDAVVKKTKGKTGGPRKARPSFGKEK